MGLWGRLVFLFLRVNTRPGLRLRLLPLLKYFLGRNPKEIVDLINSQSWEARWVATQIMAEHLAPRETLQYLYHLAQDHERFVREGAAHGLGLLIAKSPGLVDEYCERLSSPETSQALRLALLHSAVVIWRTFPSYFDQAISILTAAARQPPLGCFRTIGSHLLGVELMKSHPHIAEKLKEDWQHSSSRNLQYHAARAQGKREPPEDPGHFPERWMSTAEIPVPRDRFSQVIGQDQAVEIIRIAAKQRRFVLLIGEPGTGKSMLAQAMAEALTPHDLHDILAFPNPKFPMRPLIQIHPPHCGAKIIEQSFRTRQDARRAVQWFWGVLFIGALMAGSALSYVYKGWGFPLSTIVILLILLGLKNRLVPQGSWIFPKLLIHHDHQSDAPFVDATGLQAGALLGDVRHDPFQSGGRETPPHQLLEPGAIHLAHGGVLFIDEVGTLTMESQKHLLTAIQEKKFPIMGRSLGSSGCMVHSDPVPCEFILVVAGNKSDIQKMHPALRSRIQGYGYEIVTYSQMPDTSANQILLTRFVAQEVNKDGRIPHFTREAVELIIEHARRMTGHPGLLSLHLRQLGGIVRAAGDTAVTEEARFVEPRHVEKAFRMKRSLEEQLEEVSLLAFSLPKTIKEASI